MYQFLMIYLESQRYYFVFISAFQRRRPIKNLLQPGTLCLKTRSLTGLLLMKKQISVDHCNSSSSTHKMSLHEIHSKWARQYNYPNFVNICKRLQKKVKIELSLQCIDSDNPDNTLRNPQIYTTMPSRKKMLQNSFCMIQSFQRNNLNGTQNVALLLVFFVSFTWYFIQIFITWTWTKSTNHLDYSAVIHLINSISTTQRRKNVEQNKGESNEGNKSCFSWYTQFWVMVF